MACVYLLCVCAYETAKRERETELERKRVFFFLFHCDQLSLQLSIVCDTNPSGCLVIKEAKEKKNMLPKLAHHQAAASFSLGRGKKDGSHGHRHGFTETLVKKG